MCILWKDCVLYVREGERGKVGLCKNALIVKVDGLKVVPVIGHFSWDKYILL